MCGVELLGMVGCMLVTLEMGIFFAIYLASSNLMPLRFFTNKILNGPCLQR